MANDQQTHKFSSRCRVNGASLDCKSFLPILRCWSLPSVYRGRDPRQCRCGLRRLIGATANVGRSDGGARACRWVGLLRPRPVVQASRIRSGSKRLAANRPCSSSAIGRPSVDHALVRAENNRVASVGAHPVRDNPRGQADARWWSRRCVDVRCACGARGPAGCTVSTWARGAEGGPVFLSRKDKRLPGWEGV